jgi:hypothetical protein
MDRTIARASWDSSGCKSKQQPRRCHRGTEGPLHYFEQQFDACTRGIATRRAGGEVDPHDQERHIGRSLSVIVQPDST